MFIAPWIANAIPSVVSGALGLFGGERANRVNQREAQKTRDFQSRQAGRQMEFQERMRNTSWQAAVADMQAAGINPALAYSQGGAAAPGGAMGAGATAAAAENLSSSAMQAMQMRKTLQLMDHQVRKTASEADIAAAQERVERGRANLLVNLEGDARETRLRRLVEAEVAGAQAGATNLSATARRTGLMNEILGPTADLAGHMGMLLPILGGLTSAAGPAAQFLRAMQRRARLPRRRN